MNPIRTAISVTCGNPPPQQDPLTFHQGILANMSGCREDSDDESGDIAQRATRYKARAVTPANYDDMLQNVWKPRFRAAVPDRLSDQPDSTINVDITLQKRTPFWPSELDRVPEIHRILELVQRIERLQTHLARQPAVRRRLGQLITAAVTQGG